MRRFWTTKEDRIIKEGYRTNRLVKDIALELGRSGAAIYGRGYALGLENKRTRRGNRVSISSYVEYEIYKRLREDAVKRNTPVSVYIREIIEGHYKLVDEEDHHD